MIKYEQALRKVLNNTKELPAEKTLIEDSVGRILMKDVYSKIEMPPFNKSAMDGYALRAIDAKNIPVELKCIGIIEAGRIFKKNVGCGECVKIMTGAPLPKNTDSVVMIEYTRKLANSIRILKSLKKGENVCAKGEDIKLGQKVLEKGAMLSSDISIIAAIGRSTLKAIKKPRVAILNTGGEIVPVGARLPKNKIYNSNGPQLKALLSADGVNADFLGIAKDEPDELEQMIRNGLKKDVLLISGGVSMGDYDLVPSILKKAGVRKIFHKVRIKPGKPLFFGKRKNTIVFGIPGNPVSNFLAYYIFIRPALSKMMGEKPYGPMFQEGILEKTFHHKIGRKHFVPAKISKREASYCVTPVDNHGSADILSLSKANGFMVIDAGICTVKAKSKIKFITWEK